MLVCGARLGGPTAARGAVVVGLQAGVGHGCPQGILLAAFLGVDPVGQRSHGHAISVAKCRALGLTVESMDSVVPLTSFMKGFLHIMGGNQP